MCVNSFSQSETMAPVECSRSQEWDLYRRIQIKALDEAGGGDCTIPSRNAGKACAKTEVHGQAAHRAVRNRSLECGKFAQDYRRLIGKENTRARIEHVDARIRTIACNESERML